MKFFGRFLTILLICAQVRAFEPPPAPPAAGIKRAASEEGIAQLMAEKFAKIEQEAVPASDLAKAIIHAAFSNQKDRTKELFAQAYSPKHDSYIGLPPSFKDDKNRTLLMAAAAIGDTQILQRVMRLPININAVDSFGQTALADAVSEGNMVNVNLLLRAGALPVWFVGQTVDGNVLLNAADANNTAMVEKFLAYPEVRDHINFTTEIFPFSPLERAIAYNNYPMFQKILAVPGIELNSEMLFKALKINPQMARDLLDRDVFNRDIKVTDKVEKNDQYPIFALFKTTKNVKTDEETAELLQLLLAYGVSVNVHDEKVNRFTPLMLAVQQSKPKTVEVLLQIGARTDVKDRWGHTALWHAQRLEMGDKERIIELLKRYGARE